MEPIIKSFAERAAPELQERLKSYILDQSNPASKVVYPFIISSDNIDRSGDVVSQDGINYDYFDVTKSVFYNHDTSMPIGKCIKHEKLQLGNSKYTIGHTVFDDDDFSKKIESKVIGGSINCASIGFTIDDKNAIEILPLSINDRARIAGWVTDKCYISKLNLTEYSIVPRPMNIDAVVQKKKMLNFKNDVMENDIEKAGRTLSSATENAIQQCVDILLDLLKKPDLNPNDPENIDTSKAIEELETLTKTNDDLKAEIETLLSQKTEIENKYNNLIKKRIP